MQSIVYRLLSRVYVGVTKKRATWMFGSPRSSAVRADFEPRPVNNRAKVTNGTRLLAGVDGRSAEARRYRDLAMAFADDLGGQNKLNESERALVRQAAASVVASEKLQAALVRGDDVDPEQLVRLTNSTARLLGKLGVDRPRPKPAGPLVEHFRGLPASEAN
jgi:hypothetical protein